MDESLLKKTLRTTAIMCGASVTFVGTLTCVVLFVVGPAVAPRDASTGAGFESPAAVAAHTPIASNLAAAPAARRTRGAPTGH